MILNKTDLVSEADLERVEKRLRAINKFAPIEHSTQSNVAVDSVLDIKAFDLRRTLEMDPEFLNTEGEHEHDDTVTSLSITLPGELDLDMVERWMGDVIANKGQDIFRTKGVFAIANSNEKFVLQGVHMMFEGDFLSDSWSPKETRESKLVFIGKNLNEEQLRKSFFDCLLTPEMREQRIRS